MLAKRILVVSQMCKFSTKTYHAQNGASHPQPLQSNQNVEVSIIGAASEIGSNLATMLRQNKDINKLHLYDDSMKVHGIALELCHIPGVPTILSYAGESFLPQAIWNSHLIVLVSRIPRKPSNTRQQMLATNAPNIQRLCRVIADYNRNVFFAISTNPINSVIPLASTLLSKYNSYNPFKLLGITQIDSARARAFLAKVMKVDPKDIDLPVIGGHSDDTIIPLFSNVTPENLSVDACQADMLTRLVRKAGTEVVTKKFGVDSATLAMAWSLNEFVSKMIVAIKGGEEVVYCYTANPHYGSRYFAGPVHVGPSGIIQTSSNFSMSNYERKLVFASIPSINKDIQIGEDFTQMLQ